MAMKHHRDNIVLNIASGYSTINLSDLSSATLLIFILLMSIKPQMVCTQVSSEFQRYFR